MTGSDEIEHGVQTAQRSLGPVDVLHNNVGAKAIGGPAKLPLKAWRAC